MYYDIRVFAKTLWFVYLMVEPLMAFHMAVDCEGKEVKAGTRGSKDSWESTSRVSQNAVTYRKVTSKSKL